jgi:hypothetical protein
MELDDNSIISVLGLGDFELYNLMVLFVLSPLLSIEMKIYVGIGCMIFIQIGYVAGTLLAKFYEIIVIPAVPLPVIMFSAYMILLNVFMEDLNSNLC